MSIPFLENDLEAIIFQNRNALHTRGLPPFHSKICRQFTLPSGKRMDIFSFEIRNNELYFSVWELKKEQINSDALCQALSYHKEIKSIVGNDFKKIHGQILLIGKSFGYLPLIDYLEVDIRVYTYAYGADGISFNAEQSSLVSYPYSQKFSDALNRWEAEHPGIIENYNMKEATLDYVYSDLNEVYETNE